MTISLPKTWTGHFRNKTIIFRLTTIIKANWSTQLKWKISCKPPKTAFSTSLVLIAPIICMLSTTKTRWLKNKKINWLHNQLATHTIYLKEKMDVMKTISQLRRRLIIEIQRCSYWKCKIRSISLIRWFNKTSRYTKESNSQTYVTTLMLHRWVPQAKTKCTNHPIKAWIKELIVLIVMESCQHWIIQMRWWAIIILTTTMHMRSISRNRKSWMALKTATRMITDHFWLITFHNRIN